jgi:organic radical activating enzyme
MLDNIQVKGCEAGCWVPEQDGKISRRVLMKSLEKTHTDVNGYPEMMHINVGSDCNLTCVYCTKQYSTAWLRDIDNNGPYLDESRFLINSNDRILLNLGQKKINESESYNFIIDEVIKYNDCKEVVITGGEPLLNNNLSKLLKNFNQKVTVYTGLGVSTDRLERVLADLPENIEFAVSAENINEHYEFTRYNNSFERFERNLAILKANKKVFFSSVMSNITILNYVAFENYYPDTDINLIFCNDPDYLSINILDNTSKEMLQSTNFKHRNHFIKEALVQPYTPDQKNNFVKFILEYARRRNLNMEIFPKHFLNWLNTAQ